MKLVKIRYPSLATEAEKSAVAELNCLLKLFDGRSGKGIISEGRELTININDDETSLAYQERGWMFGRDFLFTIEELSEKVHEHIATLQKLNDG